MMRYKEPIVQRGLTATEAASLKKRYMELNPGADVRVENELDGSPLKMLIARLPYIPSAKMRDQNRGVFMAWTGR